MVKFDCGAFGVSMLFSTDPSASETSGPLPSVVLRWKAQFVRELFKSRDRREGLSVAKTGAREKPAFGPNKDERPGWTSMAAWNGKGKSM